MMGSVLLDCKESPAKQTDRESIMGKKRFTKPKFLEQIGRGLLSRLIERYRPDFTAQNVTPPDSSLEDAAYYAALGRMAVVSPGLPGDFTEALYGIEMMANAEGKDRLMLAVQERGIDIERVQEATYADFAAQVLLADPVAFAQKQDEARVLNLSSFEYHGHAEPVDRRGSSPAPDSAMLARIKGDIDAWLAEEHEGDERVTEIEMFDVEEEFMFLIRRGDTFTRMPTVEGGRLLVRHFRPARDLVAAYSPERDELRIHGKSVGEKRLIREVFGSRLFGNPNHFSVRKKFTLEPLRRDGADALAVTPGEGIDRIVLTQLEVHSDDEHDAVLVMKATDLFAYAEVARIQAIPSRGRLVRAGFDIYFSGHPKPRPVEIRAGNRLRLARLCDAAAVHRWMTTAGFRSPATEPVNRIAAPHGNGLGHH